jgi:hypothetical protein
MMAVAVLALAIGLSSCGVLPSNEELRAYNSGTYAAPYVPVQQPVVVVLQPVEQQPVVQRPVFPPITVNMPPPTFSSRPSQ